MTNKENYKIICEQRKDIPVFLQPWWLDTVCNRWDVAIAMNGSEVAGVWPFQVESKVGVALLRNPVLTPYLGPHIFYPSVATGSQRDAFEYETITKLLTEMPSAPVLTLAIQPGIKQVGLFDQYGLTSHIKQTFLLNLLQDEAQLHANMRETTRHNLRLGGAELTITNSPECIKELYRFHKSTLEAKGIKPAYTEARLSAIMKACIAHDAGSLWTARKEGRIVAMIWQLWDAHNSYYLMSARNPAEDDKRAVSVLLWHAIKYAKSMGLSSFDFEGSIDTGVEKFFRNFGGERQLYLVLKKNTSLLWKVKQMILG